MCLKRAITDRCLEVLSTFSRIRSEYAYFSLICTQRLPTYDCFSKEFWLKKSMCPREAPICNTFVLAKIKASLSISIHSGIFFNSSFTAKCRPFSMEYRQLVLSANNFFFKKWTIIRRIIHLKKVKKNGSSNGTLRDSARFFTVIRPDWTKINALTPFARSGRKPF